MAEIQEVVDGEVVVPAEVEVAEVEENESQDDNNQEDGGEVEQPWLKVEDEDGGEDVPVQTHLKIKSKLKARVSERDDEIAELKQTVAKLQAPQPSAPVDIKRPLPEDFDSDAEYIVALDSYEDKRVEAKLERAALSKAQNESVETYKRNLEQSVDDHYQRAETLLKDSGISAEVYTASDKSVRGAVEAIKPKHGDVIVDQMISLLGEGSEKVMLYVGRNKAATATLQSLLAEDASGMKAAIYLGQQKERLTNPQKRRTKAPAPAPSVNGDIVDSGKDGAFKKKYNAAYKKGNIQDAYNAKKEAKAAGVDVRNW